MDQSRRRGGFRGSRQVGPLWLALLAAMALLELASPAAAGPGRGTDLTASSNTWWIHADEGFGAWMSNVQQEGTDPYSGWGPNQPNVAPPGLGSVSTSFPLTPAPAQDIHLDTDKQITMEVWVGGGTAGQVFVTPSILVDGEVLASGEELSASFANGGLVHLGWDLTARLETIPAGAAVEWTFRLSGAYDAAFYWMEGDSWTSVTLPVVDLAAQPDVPDGAAGTTTGAPTSSSTASATSTGPSTSPRPPGPTSTGSPSATGAPPSGQPAGQGGTGASATEPASKESPSFALPAVLVALALPLLLRRR